MTTIAENTLRLLEFEEIRLRVAERCLSEEGRELVESQPVSSDRAAIDAVLGFACDLRRLIETEPLPSVEFPPIRTALPKLRKSGTVAEGLELASIGQFARSAATVRSFLAPHATREAGPRPPRLTAFAEGLPDLSRLAARILDVMEADGSVNEERVPELKAIRREMQGLHTEIEGLTAHYLASDRSIWQADVPTQRDGRTVLPLKSGYRTRITGIVHEVSATGATLFIEPMDIVEKNNELVERQNRYRREVHRVLKELTETVRERLDELELTVDEIARFDAAYARARFAATARCTRAEPSEGRVILKRARHPLLGPKAVPLDFELGGTATVMVITGANAGGKTVSLKTVGLLALMNQWGMEIPAEEGSTLPLFDHVLVDIGDDQSIANSLSTFSGHMKALSAIVAESGPASLVLLDEVGSGTDPSEGSALAMAVLDHLLAQGSLVVATTHHGIIKRYGFSKPGVVNASVAFDAATLSPTYQLVIGEPGESHALEIAARSRIPQAILDAARAYVDEQRTDLDRAVEELAARRRELDERDRRLAESAEGLERRESQIERRENRIEEQELQVREREFGELKAFVVESRKGLENLVRELRTGEITREKTRKVKAYINNLDEKLADEESGLADDRTRSAGPEEGDEAMPGPIVPGTEVYVGKNKRRGTIVRRERGDKWLVMVNRVRMSVPSGDLVPVARPRSRPDERLSVVVAGEGEPSRAQIELDIRGMRLEEAVAALERQLDRAILSGLSEFSVIHGKGEGVLREGVQRVLRESSAVSEFFFSPPEAGGYGKTIVKLGG